MSAIDVKLNVFEGPLDLLCLLYTSDAADERSRRILRMKRILEKSSSDDCLSTRCTSMLPVN